MPSWNELLTTFEAQPDSKKIAWLESAMQNHLAQIRTLRGDRCVILYLSGFLQKPQAPANHYQITYEDINGLMSILYGMDCSAGLTLVLHTSGGMPNAAESIVSYLRSKFPYIEVIIPTFAMSAGTMISLAADKIIMGRPSQLGPIDPQFLLASGGTISARAVVDQFERAKNEIANNQVLAHAWAPVLQSMGPSLLQEAQLALDYGETMVSRWLCQYMFKNETDPDALAAAAAKHFNDAQHHKSHARRIDRDEARSQKLSVDDLEDVQELQEAVLTAYHLGTIMIQKSNVVKILVGHHGRLFVKSWTG